ncbi:conserved hypothetical protein [Theileria orientalis strain Shintoku]|uniref:Uncharacterized protein n=1 Tax=Theileria orientalis strain Shintoku TaxID=869250 RepID=J4DPF0_THEOR|nr:conserved hypothetical protein [Theileria orientalis strain Shintoku]BAM40589.1 conserved hypothetical protein [Theileria orientalis strain Shintoku]|eukprot:XP_009690890.1 conserved hypothetical protein [Theileria orientalis strain Shintoku]
MNLYALYVNSVAFMLLFASRYSCLEDILIENELAGPEAEPQSPDAAPSTSEEFQRFQDPNLYNNGFVDPKTQFSDTELPGSEPVKNPTDVRFYALDPNDGSKVVEIPSDKYKVRQNSINPFKFEYELADDAHCIKVKCDGSTIWRSGDFRITEAKFVIFSTKSDRITIRDHERYVTYRLVDDTMDQAETPLPAKDELTEPGLPSLSSVTYVTHVSEPVKVSTHRVQPSTVVFMISLFSLLVLMTLMLVGLLLLVVRLYRVVDQIKFDFGATETKVVL